LNAGAAGSASLIQPQVSNIALPAYPVTCKVYQQSEQPLFSFLGFGPVLPGQASCK